MKLKNALAISAMIFSVMATGSASAYWRCSAYDGTGRFWDRKAPGRLTAIYKVRRACESLSPLPEQCVVPALSCIRFSPERTSCVVRDRRGRKWYDHGRAPCVKAIRRCRHWHNKRGITGFSCWVIGSV